MSDISKFINHLYKLERTGLKYNLKNIKSLMQALHNPHEKLKCIHIAGTNGKGGTASFIASVLMEHGIKTGLFTSPHILKFNERIRINGNCVPDLYIKKFLNDNSRAIERIKPSFFEVNTALAFKYFADNNVEAAVIETGLGGRLDSTNIINPLLTIITHIGIDHTEYLGDTLQKIAKEKIGIVKPNIDVIISDNHKTLRKAFRNCAKGSKIFFLDDYLDYEILKADINGSKFRVWVKKDLTGFENLNGTFTIPLPGEYQVRNAATAMLSVYRFFHYFKMDSRLRGNDTTPLKQSLASEEIRQGLENVKINSGYSGRFEYVKRNGKNYIFDVSHNPDGIEAMGKTAKKVLKTFKKIVVIFAMMKEKNYKSAIDKLANFADYIIFTKPDYDRALTPLTLHEYAAGSRKSIFAANNVKEALKKAEVIAGKNDITLITGSFFLVSEAIRELGLEGKFA